MTDISAKLPAYGAFAAAAAAMPRDGAQQPALRNGSFSDGVKQPKQKADGLASMEKMIDHYVPKDIPNTRLQIEHDKDTGIFIYRSIDNETGEVVRQYPAAEILRFISYYRESEGLVVDSEA
ncbi:flagellar protein FlaG [Govanella unica]|uniref:Flagellar protein FlaG n=1 Tax=Govanella unica TaxID=2975056 RepID=A0A9X3TX19_9PROT|nr:flagellar protein FlaG [Govania unica]MDA5193208.1 flagellar protein FlaG [Govania unica]